MCATGKASPKSLHKGVSIMAKRPEPRGKRARKLVNESVGLYEMNPDQVMHDMGEVQIDSSLGLISAPYTDASDCDPGDEGTQNGG